MLTLVALWLLVIAVLFGYGAYQTLRWPHLYGWFERGMWPLLSLGSILAALSLLVRVYA